MAAIYYGIVVGTEYLICALGLTSLAAFYLWLGLTKPSNQAQVKALAKARTIAQQDGPQIHKAWNLLENFQKGVKRGTSSKGRVYYYIRDTVHQDMDVYRSTGSREYVGAVSLSGGPIHRYQQKMGGRTFKP